MVDIVRWGGKMCSKGCHACRRCVVRRASSRRRCRWPWVVDAMRSILSGSLFPAFAVGRWQCGSTLAHCRDTSWPITELCLLTTKDGPKQASSTHLPKLTKRYALESNPSRLVFFCFRCPLLTDYSSSPIRRHDHPGHITMLGSSFAPATATCATEKSTSKTSSFSAM